MMGFELVSCRYQTILIVNPGNPDADAFEFLLYLATHLSKPVYAPSFELTGNGHERYVFGHE